MPYVEDHQDGRASAWADAISLLTSNGADEKVLNIVVHEATWYVPLRDKQPRFADLRYWTEGARKALSDKERRREHVTPRSPTKTKIAGRDREEVRGVLASMVVCVVSTTEHEQLERFAHLDGWDRYRAAGLRVYDQKDGRWLW